MRLLALIAAAVAALAVAAAPAAPATSRCSSHFTLGGHTYIVIASLSCSQAIPIARRLVTAPTIGRVTLRGTTVLKLRPPGPGWICATASSTRDKGASCRRGADHVTEVRVS